MDPQTPQSSVIWALAHAQHGVVTRQQLLAAGYGPDAVKHRVRRGRLHPLGRGVYALGRPAVSRRGELMAAVLVGGDRAVLSHASAAELWEIRPRAQGPIELSILNADVRGRPGVRAHRRSRVDTTTLHHIPLTTATQTLLDLATRLTQPQLERSINQADALDLIDPETLRYEVDRHRGTAGVAALRETLDRRTYRTTDSRLEHRMLKLVRRAGLPLPETQRHADGFRVDFLWPDLGLVVEADSLRYHRTPAQQHRDRLRDQAHHAAGRTPLRFTHGQISFGADHVAATLLAVANRLSP